MAKRYFGSNPISRSARIRALSSTSGLPIWRRRASSRRKCLTAIRGISARAGRFRPRRRCEHSSARFPSGGRSPDPNARQSPAYARPSRRSSAYRSVVFRLALLASVAANARPPEPDGYRMDDYRAPTPETVVGAAVLDTEAAHKLWQIGEAVWIDVLPAPHRPANLPLSALWMPLPHHNIPDT